MDFFKNAKQIFANNYSSRPNFQVGFYKEIDYIPDVDGKVTLCITGKNIFRLYINGNIVFHGPARTAHGYARVDSLDITDYLIPNKNKIAVEVIEYSSKIYGGYSNDSTLEDGFIIAESYNMAGKSIFYTDTGWKSYTINQRDAISERISHCRECSEVYHLDDEFFSWRLGTADFEPVIEVNIPTIYLPHEALNATLYENDAKNLYEYGKVETDEKFVHNPSFFEAGYPDIYQNLTERPLLECKSLKSIAGNIILKNKSGEIELDGDNTYVSFDMKKSYVGFAYIEIESESEGIADIIPNELLTESGENALGDINYVTRLHVKPGKTKFYAMEPTLCRYLKIIFRIKGKVTLKRIGIMEYFYPDEHKSTFICSDDDINRLYDAAKNTLLLNTMDIFMDCPERERGGWLCDSLWTGRAAALMLSDTRVEREFIENFLLTDPKKFSCGLFPEVYPANKPNYDVCAGLVNWSFWLMCELCEFVERTGDKNFAEKYYPRVEAFVNGMLAVRGKSGLFENLPFLFIDWASSNNAENLYPISVPTNAHFIYTLLCLSKLYKNKDWEIAALQMREILRSALDRFANSEITVISDNLTINDGKLSQTSHYSEAALYTDLWSNLFENGENKILERYVRDCMGPAPKSAPAPYIGRSGLFIGLCIRLDMLARRGFYDKLFEDICAICMPQLKEGPGTLWESEVLNTSSRCHGFMSHIGVHLMRDILGIGIENKLEKTISITPNPCSLRWAKGTHEIDGQIMSLSWVLTEDSFDMKITLPEGYKCNIILPVEIKSLGEENIRIDIK